MNEMRDDEKGGCTAMRPKEETLWKIVEEYERQNGINKSKYSHFDLKSSLSHSARLTLINQAQFDPAKYNTVSAV